MPEELIQLSSDPIRKIPQEILLIRMGENFYTKDHKEGSFTLDHNAADKILQEFDSRGIGVGKTAEVRKITLRSRRKLP